MLTTIVEKGYLFMIPDNASIVVLASNYNPSIVSKEWLGKKEIFTSQINNFVHTPVLSVVENDDYAFAVDEQKLQLIIKKPSPKNIENSSKMVSLFVDALPETPFKSIGINYNYVFPKSNCGLDILFSTKERKIKEIFSSKYELGTVVLFAFENFTVNFSMSPSLTEDKTRLSFNFHSGVFNSDDIKKCLTLQPVTMAKAEEIVTRLTK